MKKIAYFISSHGFGHAARAFAVMHELNKLGKYQFVIFSEVPLWFFQETLKFKFDYKIYKTDVGLIQNDPFIENLKETIKALEKIYPVASDELLGLSKILSKLKIDLVICDISPIGILAANSASIPSLLIENFTWDWIYKSYQDQYPEFTKFTGYLQDIFNEANFHLQTEPICNQRIKYPLINPIFREPTQKRKQIRNELGVGQNELLVLITMGGIPFIIPDSLSFARYKNLKIVFPGANVKNETVFENILFLPHHHHYFHPNLVHASDIVIGKIGYSTIAETFSACLPFLFISRKGFRESFYLEEFVKKRMIGKEIERNFLDNDDWLSIAMEFYQRSRGKTQIINGANEASDFIMKII
ncbi:MAG TPA: glycosyltransferase family protein [Anaerovoracaceae bacterium]|nr:glycosyltransferase family protein [Anaerovoracaceae bacterium]